MTKEEIADELVDQSVCPLGAVWISRGFPCSRTGLVFGSYEWSSLIAYPNPDDFAGATGLPEALAWNVSNHWDSGRHVKALQTMEKADMLREVEDFVKKKGRKA